jgi:hypothetical protein
LLHYEVKLTFIELPSLEQIEEMEQTKARLIAALEIDNEANTVKCQSCNQIQKITIEQGKSNLTLSNSI